MKPAAEVAVFFAPPQTSDPLDACELTDLIACLKTKTFHTLFEVSLSPQKRPSKSQNTFFCPVCPATPVVIAKSPFTISCPVCKWNAADHGIATVSDLLLADSRPFHHLFKRIRVLGETLSSRDPLATPMNERDLMEDGDDDNEIPLERRFDVSVKRREQEPARRRITRGKVSVSVNGVDVGTIDNTVWKIKHSGEKVLPRMRISRSGKSITLHAQNEHNKDMVVTIREKKVNVPTGGEYEFIFMVDKGAGWAKVDMLVEYIDGVYCGSWNVRVFFK